MAKKLKTKKTTLFYVAAILFSALVIAMAFLPVFSYKTAVTTTNINAFQLMTGSFSETTDTSNVVGVVSTLLGLSETIKTASIFLLATISLGGISVLLALVGLLMKRNFRIIQFAVMALCFVAAVVSLVLLFVAGGELTTKLGNTVLTKGIVQVGAYLMTLFALIGAGSCIALKK